MRLRGGGGQGEAGAGGVAGSEKTAKGEVERTLSSLPGPQTLTVSKEREN